MTMTIKIKKLKNFGIYRDFTWSNTTPQFQRYNLIYGWNKSGKSTLSRVFLACEKKAIHFKNYPQNGEFQIEFEDNTKFNQTNVQDCNFPIRVFNTDFVEENVSFDPSNVSNPIVYLSEEDIKKIEKLNDLRTQRIQRDQEFLITKQDREDLEGKEDAFRVKIARSIKDTLTTTSADKYRNYDKRNLQQELENKDLKNLKELSKTNKNQFLERTRKNSNPLNALSHKEIKTFELSTNTENFSSIETILAYIASGLSRQVSARTISKLKKDPKLNSWVQAGYKIHEKHAETETCLFCGNPLEEKLLGRLSDHFSAEYQQTQKWAHQTKAAIEKMRFELFDTKNENLYPELQSKFEQEATRANKIIEKANSWIDKTIQKIEAKYQNPLKEYKIPNPPEDLEKNLANELESINSIIDEHNLRVQSHDSELLELKQKIELHIIAEAIRTDNYEAILQDLEAGKRREGAEREKLETIDEEVSELENETSDIAIAVEEINRYLIEFFGRKEISIELDKSKQGYIIHREGEVANSLSEGEKNAIAFAYFIVKTKEKNFDVKKATIVIDDPISSFDSNFIYHCFSLIKNNFGESRQLIISTHNFEFFNLVKNWYQQKASNASRKANKQGEEPKPNCEYFMLENPIIDEKRCACIQPLDETLKNYKSEYQYLFSRLNLFNSGDIQDYDWFYIIGNLARRFLEAYLNFKIPNTGDLKSKIDQLDTPSVSNVEKDKLYQLIQEESHGRDSMGALGHKDKSETITAIEILFKLVQESDPKHFETLQKNV